ncbi:MAG TPA: hypothetical protein PKO06_03415 [Candidatus Ozemobacteraceae bacterium]|nr:hypothetical protein [Candidatus Ozemobacteraceae bacterium]
MSLIWLMQFWLFWLTACPVGDAITLARECYILPTPAGRQFFYLSSRPVHQPTETIIARHTSPFSPPLCRYRTRPVFKLRSGDIDGDGREELIAGVTRPDLGHQRRIYVFTLDDRLMRPRWFGTRLSFHLDWFDTIPVGSRVGLTTREHGRKFRYRIVYRWYYWGFRTVRIQKEDQP